MRDYRDDIDWANPIDYENPISRDLEGAWMPLPSSRAEVLYDLTPNRLNLPLLGSAYWGASNGYPVLKCDIGAGDAARANAPSRLQLTSKFTLMWWSSPLGTPGNFNGQFGVTYTNSNTPPYFAYGIQAMGGATFRLSSNNSGTAATQDTSVGLTSRSRLVCFAWACNGATWEFYVDGTLNGSWSQSNTISYGGTPTVFVGSYGFYSTSAPYIAFAGGHIWSRALNSGEIKQLSLGGPQAMLRRIDRTRSRGYVAPVAGANPKAWWGLALSGPLNRVVA